MICDLHVHSRFSDGGKTVEELLDIAHQNKVDIISFTDHNTFEAYKKTNDSKPENITIITGIEIDTLYKDKRLHMLLYCFNPKSKIMAKYEKIVRKSDIKKFKRMIKQLERLHKIKIDKHLVKTFIQNNQYFDKVKLNDLLVYQGLCENGKEAYYTYTKEVNEAPRKAVDIRQVFEMEAKSGGFLVLAHPMNYVTSLDEVKDLILDLKNTHHLRAVEAINNRQTDDQTKFLVKLCLENDILISGGSDYHAQYGVEEKKKIGYALGKKIDTEQISILIELENKI